jgi:hypothetical protein
MKTIVYLPVKNDKWIIEKSILSISKWADHLFVADESSDDGSLDIYSKLSFLENVSFIKRPKFDQTGPDNRNYLLNLARSFDGENLIFELHADEIISARILNPDFKLKYLESLKPRSSLLLPWYTLWEKPHLYRDDKSIWSNNYCWFGYRDDRKVKFTGACFHGPRAPEETHVNKVVIDELPVLHYQFLNKSNERSKQAIYHIFERNHYPKKSTEQINKTYAVAFDDRGVKLKVIPDVHTKLWLDAGININEVYERHDLNWRDLEILRNFKKYGLDYYKNVNIWYIDWELKRKEAMELPGYDGYSRKIIDPRDLSTKMAHWWVTRFQRYAYWRFDFIKFAVKKVAGIVATRFK